MTGMKLAASIAAFGWIGGLTSSVAADMAKGFLRGPAYEAERLIRTELANAYGAHHQRGIEDFAEGEEEKVLKRWDASRDRHCALCHALDGETVEVDETFSSGHMYEPRHPNCRCVVIPWMEHWLPTH